MLGAIAGDVIGSVYEHAPVKHKDFRLLHHECTFTDDTVLTVAVADALLTGASFADALQRWARRFPNRGYGIRFARWFMAAEPEPYNSFGNGAAMRVSPVGWWYGDADTVLAEARRTAVCSHDHPEGIRGAQAVALAVYLARQGWSQAAIQERVTAVSGYDLATPLAAIRPDYGFEVSCQGSVPQALRAFLEAEDSEDAIRNAISLGGDADTQAAIAGSVAEAAWGLSPALETAVRERLPDVMLAVIDRFRTAVATQ